MGISLSHPRLSLEDRFDLAYSRALRKIRHPQILEKESYLLKL